MIENASFQAMAAGSSAGSPDADKPQNGVCRDEYINALLEDILAIKRPTLHAVMALSPDGDLIAISAQSHQNMSLWLDRGTPKMPEGMGPHLLGSAILIINTQTGHAASPFPEGSKKLSPGLPD